MAAPDRLGRGAVAVAALAAGRTIAAAAREAGISERTLRRRLADTGFAAQVHAARARIIEEAVGRLAGAAAGAIETLVRLLTSANEPVVVSAAKGLLDNLLRYRAAHDLDERLTRIEDAVAELAARRNTPTAVTLSRSTA